MQSESLSTTAEETPNNLSSSELLEIIPIKDSPFTAVRVDTKYFLALGKYRLTSLLDSYEDAEAEITNTSWHRILQVMEIVMEERLEEENRKRLNNPPTIQ